MTALRINVVKNQLDIIHDESDEKIEWCMEKAEAVVYDYLKVTEQAFLIGSPAITFSLPAHIEAAMILVVRQFFDGDWSTDPITPAVVSLLARSRDPALA